jgi:hypothetical protein
MRAGKTGEQRECAREGLGTVPGNAIGVIHAGQSLHIRWAG